jgi:hypothetical protein
MSSPSSLCGRWHQLRGIESDQGHFQAQIGDLRGCMLMTQVSVASADDFAFGPIAAYSAIEAARESAAQANNPKGDAAVGRRLSLAFTGEQLTQMD